MQRVERETLHGHHLLVAHHADSRSAASSAPNSADASRAQLRRVLELGHARDVDVDRIAEEAADRAVRTDVVSAIEQRVQRIHSDEVRADRAAHTASAARSEKSPTPQFRCAGCTDWR